MVALGVNKEVTRKGCGASARDGAGSHSFSLSLRCLVEALREDEGERSLRRFFDDFFAAFLSFGINLLSGWASGFSRRITSTVWEEVPPRVPLREDAMGGGGKGKKGVGGGQGFVRAKTAR